MKFYRPTKWIYLPTDMVGWGIDLLLIVFLLDTFVAIDRHSHSASDTLYSFLLYGGITFLLREWFAGKTSR